MVLKRASPILSSLTRMLDVACAAPFRSLQSSAAPCQITLSEEEVDVGYDRSTTDWSVSKAAFDGSRFRESYIQSSYLAIDAVSPNFSADAVIDNEITQLNAADYAGKWVLLFFYPKDFTFVCPTEIIAFSDRVSEFRERGCEVIGASCDSAEVHLAWIRTARKAGGLGHMQIPLLADVDRRISAAYGVLGNGNFPHRGIFLMDPEGRLKSMQIVMNDVGRSVDEALRLLDAFQYVAEHGVVCPADWKPGDATMQADPEGSLEYFSKADSSKDDASFADALAPIKSAQHFKDAISVDKLVVVDVMAGWCGKCRMIAPYVEQLQSEFTGVDFYKLDSSEAYLEGLSQDIGVKSLPAFKFYRGSKEVTEAIVGFKKKPLRDAIEKYSQ